MVQKIGKGQRQTNIMTAACVAAVLMMSLVVGTAQATPLDLVLEASPDIYANQIATDYAYNSGIGSGIFTAKGFALTLTDNGITSDIIHGVFDLSAEINKFGGHHT